jgi:hypothetical protein
MRLAARGADPQIPAACLARHLAPTVRRASRPAALAAGRRPYHPAAGGRCHPACATGRRWSTP